jgi:hypothetical protein
MTNAQVLERGREAFQRKAWAESYRLLHAAEREAALEPEDLEPLAMAGYLMGRDDESESAMAPAAGWFARAQRVQLECVVRGYLLIPAAIQRIMEGDPAAAHAAVTHAAGIASRFGDRSLLALACHGRGRALIRLGSISDG